MDATVIHLLLCKSQLTKRTLHRALMPLIPIKHWATVTKELLVVLEPSARAPGHSTEQHAVLVLMDLTLSYNVASMTPRLIKAAARQLVLRNSLEHVEAFGLERRSVSLAGRAGMQESEKLAGGCTSSRVDS